MALTKIPSSLIEQANQSIRGDPGITYSALSDFDVEGLNGGKNAPTGLHAEL